MSANLAGQTRSSRPLLGIFPLAASRLPSVAGVIVEIEEVEPGGDVFAFGRNGFVELVEIIPAFHVCRAALFLGHGPREDLAHGRFVLRVGVDPVENGAVTLSGGELLFEGGWVHTDKTEEPLVERACIFVFADFSGDCRAAFVEEARQNHVTTKPHARAARRT